MLRNEGSARLMFSAAVDLPSPTLSMQKPCVSTRGRPQPDDNKEAKFFSHNLGGYYSVEALYWHISSRTDQKLHVLAVQKMPYLIKSLLRVAEPT